MNQAKATKTSPATRLSEIWRAWGLNQQNTEAKAQQKALAAVVKFLTGGAPAIFRGMQALLVDPDEPGASKRPLFESLWSAAQEHWPAVGTGDGDVMLMQAMLLAAWPESQAEPELGPTLLSPWMASRGRPRQREELKKWRVQCATEVAEFGDVDISLPAAIKAAKLASPALAALEGLQPNQYITNVSTGYQNIQIWAPAGFEPFKKAIHAAVAESNNRSAMLYDKTQQVTERIWEFVSRQTENNSTLEYMWWGQARYCHTLQMPFRRIDHMHKAVWLAAVEAAERAAWLPVEPSASYLQEVLHSLGAPLQEKRAIREHLGRLREVLPQHPRQHAISSDLLDLLEQDSFGVPISLLCANPNISDEVLWTQTGIAPDTELDLGEWSAWVFRELVFQRRWPEQA